MIVEIKLAFDVDSYISIIMKVFQNPELTFAETANAFAALGSEQRLCIMRVLVRAGEDGLRMGELAERTETGASTLTHHLKFLTAAGLVVQEKSGRSVICAAVSYERIEALKAFLSENCCADAAESDHEHG